MMQINEVTWLSRRQVTKAFFKDGTLLVQVGKGKKTRELYGVMPEYLKSVASRLGISIAK